MVRTPEKSQSYPARFKCRAIIGTPAKRHSMAFRWWADDGHDEDDEDETVYQVPAFQKTRAILLGSISISCYQNKGTRLQLRSSKRSILLTER